MNIIICDEVYLHTVRRASIVLHPLLKGYVIPLVLLTLKFHDLHPFLYIHLHPVYMLTPFLTVRPIVKEAPLLLND